MRSAGFHQANAMASTLDTIRNEVLAEVWQVQDNVISAVGQQVHIKEFSPNQLI